MLYLIIVLQSLNKKNSVLNLPILLYNPFLFFIISLFYMYFFIKNYNGTKN